MARQRFRPVTTPPGATTGVVTAAGIPPPPAAVSFLPNAVAIEKPTMRAPCAVAASASAGPRPDAYGIQVPAR